jgi:hypothetical protein
MIHFVYTHFWQKVPKSITSIENHTCTRIVENLFHIHEVLDSVLDSQISYLNRYFSKLFSSTPSVLWLGYSVGLISDGTEFLFQNLAHSNLPSIFLHNGYRRSFTIGYRWMNLNIYLHAVYIFKKLYPFPITRKLPLVEKVFSMTTSRSSARTATL